MQYFFNYYPCKQIVTFFKNSFSNIFKTSILWYELSYICM